MTDDNGHRSVPLNGDTPNNSDNQTYAQAAAETASNAISHMAPAEKGWILASVILFLGGVAMIEGTNYLESETSARSVETFLLKVEDNRSQEMRRSQETVKSLAQALSRQSDRIGRKAAALPEKQFLERKVEEEIH